MAKLIDETITIENLRIVQEDWEHFEALFKGLHKIKIEELKYSSNTDSLNDIPEATFQVEVIRGWKKYKSQDYHITPYCGKQNPNIHLGQSENFEPDFVYHIHQSKEVTKRETEEGRTAQMIIAEIKMIQRINSPYLLMNDFYKLVKCVFDFDGLEFKYGIFILGMGGIDDIQTYLAKYPRADVTIGEYSINNLHTDLNAENHQRRILCIAFTKEGHIECQWLEDLLKKIIRRF